MPEKLYVVMCKTCPWDYTPEQLNALAVNLKDAEAWRERAAATSKTIGLEGHEYEVVEVL